jgi:hypothetical protein
VTSHNQTIEIPAPLYSRLQALAKSEGVASPSAYIVNILRETVASKEPFELERSLSPEDVEKIQDRLKRLGYI